MGHRFSLRLSRQCSQSGCNGTSSPAVSWWAIRVVFGTAIGIPIECTNTLWPRTRAWRPEKVQKGAFAIHPQFSEAFCGVGGRRYTSSICNPERAATRSFQSILKSGRYALLPKPHWVGCRIGGPQSAVVHQHGYVGQCVRDLARNASYEAPRLASKPTPVARASSSNPACVALAQRIREGGRCRAGRFCNARGRCYGNSACRLCETR